MATVTDRELLDMATTTLNELRRETRIPSGSQFPLYVEGKVLRRFPRVEQGEQGRTAAGETNRTRAERLHPDMPIGKGRRKRKRGGFEHVPLKRN